MVDRRVAERYQTIEVVGRGGEATVLKAIDTRHQRLVALKVRSVTAGHAPEDLLAEARVLLSLPPHPGLAHARDDLLDDDRHVIVLDWVEGVNLARLLADEGHPGLPISGVLRWVAQTAEALTVLHHHGLVHGDVKPANLILDRTGRVVVVDLGSSSVPLTAGPRGGTPGYRAPEVAAGSPADRASDVYSLAATAFALFTGSPPIGELPAWNGVPAAVAGRLEAALRAGLALDPARRPPTPGAFVEQLRAGWDDATPTGVVTVLLTDVVDSSMLWEQAPDEVPALLAEMQLVVDRAVEQAGGRRVGATVEGDATVSVFPNALKAVGAAIELQRALAARSTGLRVRAGAATGELVNLDGDVHGPTVNRAARVRELAKAGEIFLSASTAGIVRLASPPGVELVALGPHVLRGMDGSDEIAAVVADGVAAPPDPARPPYPGLAAFRAEDADLFFGREAVIERCVQLLRTSGFVAVVGASGSGKSSVALAGIAPQLSDVVVVRPGTDPPRSIAEADLAGRSSAVAIVDQLEELITLCHDPDDRTAFVDALLDHPGGVVITIRADLYGEFGAFPELADRLAGSHVLLGPLTERDVVRAIEEPARRCGLVIEPGLAELITAELGDGPGALPLLGHALREAWSRREGRTITRAGYRASGGVRSAIAATAERAYAELDDSGRRTARQILVRMVELRPDGDDARSWVAHRELCAVDPERAPEVIRTLTDARLLVVDGQQVTVVHEALLRAWPRLEAWIAEQRADLLAHQEMRWAADRWVAGGRSDGDLYRGMRLDAAIELAARERLIGQDAEFVDAGRRLQEREQAERRRRTRRLRTLAIASTAFAVVALVVGLVAVVQRNDAEDARAAADQAATVADDQRAAADAAAVEAAEAADVAEEQRQQADAARADADAERDGAQVARLVAESERLLDSQLAQALLLAVESRRRADTPATRGALLTALTANLSAEPNDRTFSDGGVPRHRTTSSFAGFLDDPPGLRYNVDVSADGRIIVSSGQAEDGSGLAVIYDTARREEIGRLADADANVDVSPDGRHVLVGLPSLMLYDVERRTSTPIETPDAPTYGLFVGDGSQFVLPQGEIDSPDFRWWRWDTATLAPIAPLPPQVVMGPAITTTDGRLIILAQPPGNERRVAVLWDPAAPDDVREVVLDEPTNTGGPLDLARFDVSADGTVLAAAQGAGQVRLWDLGTGDVLPETPDRPGAVRGLAFDPLEPGTLVSGGPQGAELYDVLAERPIGEPLAGHAGGLRDVAFTADGELLVTLADDGVGLWRRDDAAGPFASPLVTGFTNPMFGGDRLALAAPFNGAGAEIRAADDPSRSGVPLAIEPGVGPHLILSADGSRVIASPQANVVVADTATGQQILAVPGVALYSDLSVDGRLLSTVVRTDGPTRLELWDVDAGVQLAAVTTDDVGVLDLFGAAVFTDDGRHLDVPIGAGVARLAVPELTLVRTVDAPSLVQGRVGHVLGTEDVITAGVGGRIHRLDMSTGTVVASGQSRDSSSLNDVAVSADGGLVAAYHPFSSRLALFDGATLRPIGRPFPVGDLAFLASFEPGGGAVVGNGLWASQSTRWEMDPDAWQASACLLAGRNLTPDEWRDYFSEPYRETCSEW